MRTTMTSVPIERLSSSGVPSATMRPWSMMPTRSASASASSRYWVVRKIVMPSSSLSRLHLLPHPAAAHRVEPGGGLVEEQHVGVVHERGGEVEPALHAARSRCRSAGPWRRRCRRGRGGRSTRCVELGVAQAVEPALQPQQLGAGLLGVEGGVLQGDADAQPHLARARWRRRSRRRWPGRRWARAACRAPARWWTCRRRWGRGTRRSRRRGSRGRRRRRPRRRRSAGSAPRLVWPLWRSSRSWRSGRSWRSWMACFATYDRTLTVRVQVLTSM